MWLLDVKTFNLKFFANPPPRYAILSHTWDGDEVVFQDMKDIVQAQQKDGWKKIQFTCEEAKKDDLPYAWVDTCCIDKASSAELSEAINSMFEWYRQAQCCYAYLSDFKATFKPSILRKADIKHFLAKCRWFTRGWTLQELIASPKIVFFNVSWEVIGTNNTLQSCLAKITGIDEEVLENMGHMYQVPAGRRMSWAAKRQTTRVEDLAYCLLGIFNVNMPLLYGEGEKAFLRLQEQITREHPDLSLFAWRQQSSNPEIPGSSPEYRGIFAQSPAEFIKASTLIARKPSLFPEANFSVTDAGLLINIDLGLSHSRDIMELDLKCLNTAGVAYSKAEVPQWVGIYMQRFGDTYVRYRPWSFSHPMYGNRFYYRPDFKKQATICIKKTLTRSHNDYFKVIKQRSLVLTYGPGLEDVCTKVIPDVSILEHSFNSSDLDDIGATYQSAGLELSNSQACHMFGSKAGGDLVWWASFDIPQSDGMDLNFAVVCGIPGNHEASSDVILPWFALFFSEDSCFEHSQMVILADDHPRMDCSPETQNRVYDAMFGIFADSSGKIVQDILPTRAAFTDSDGVSREVCLNVLGGGETYFCVDIQYI